MHKVVVIDTSLLCCYLSVPGKDTAGSADDRWDAERVSQIISERIEEGYFLVLPLASLIETGNHIAQAATRRFEKATELSVILRGSTNGDEPWAAFSEQAELFDAKSLLELAARWPSLAAGGTSIGDYLIKDVAEFYAKAGMSVEILTGDAGLKAYEPSRPLRVPRRRS